MPKEICHWLIANEVFDRLPPAAPARRLIADHQHLYLLGAVLPDSPAYMKVGQHAGTIIQGGKGLHDAPDSFLLLRKSLASRGQNLQDGEAALLLGMVTHLLVDSLFHPLIFYFCGLDRTRHFTFETYLDLYLRREQGAPLFGWRVDRLLRELERPIGEVAEFSRSLFFGRNTWPATGFVAMLKQHGLIQAQFSGQAARLLLVGLNRLPGIDLAPYLALFYPRQPLPPELLFTALPDYRHPVTGAWAAADLLAIKERAVCQLAHLFAELTEPPTTWLTLLGALSTNANTGQPGKRARHMRYFAGLSEVMSLIIGGSGRS